MIRSVKPPFLFKRIYNKLEWEFPATDKALYLTFDDGPVPGITEKVLDLLEKYDAKATFFCIGGNIEKHARVFDRLRLSGHTLGNHTYHHLNGWKTDNKLYFESVERTRPLVESNLFRPPYGRIRLSQASQLKPRYRIIMWNVLSYDFDQGVSNEQCLENVTRNVVPGSVVVFHDSLRAADTLEYVLPRVLEHFSKQGYRFNGIPDNARSARFEAQGQY